MPDYRESTAQASTWRRAFAVHLSNPYSDVRGVLFEEEDVIQMAGQTVKTPVGNVAATFVAEETFPLLDVRTGQATGRTASHMDVYVLLNSLYMDLATKRDAARVVPVVEGDQQ